MVVENANDSVTQQQSQVENAITKGAKAIMLVSVDPNEATGALESAQQAGVPVIAYDHNTQNGPLAGFDVYNSVAVGQLQARARLPVPVPGRAQDAGPDHGEPW